MLIDPGRRAFYDQTGQIKPSSADNDLAEILSVLAGAFDEGCRAAMQSHDDLTKTDLVARMRSALDKRSQELSAGRAESEQAVALLEPLLGRFSTTDGSANRIEMLIMDKQRMAREIGERMRIDLERIAKARAFLENYHYRSDPTIHASYASGLQQAATEWQQQVLNGLMGQFRR